MEMTSKTVFLSHSTKDIEKARKIRDILEELGYDPLLFHLKCLDDDNENLESFIKKEIEARSFFIYCKSQNSENSVWVQKELEYIKSFDNKRLFTIDITLPLGKTLVRLLESIAEIVKKNRVFISCSNGSPDKEFGDQLERFLTDNNYDVVRFNVLDYAKDFEHKKELSEANTFIPIISSNSLTSVYCKSELERVLYDYEKSPDTFSNKVVPIFYGISAHTTHILPVLPSTLHCFKGIEVSYNSKLTHDQEKEILKLINAN